MGPFLSHIPLFFVLENCSEDIICTYVNCHNTYGSELVRAVTTTYLANCILCSFGTAQSIEIVPRGVPHQHTAPKIGGRL